MIIHLLDDFVYILTNSGRDCFLFPMCLRLSLHVLQQRKKEMFDPNKKCKNNQRSTV